MINYKKLNYNTYIDAYKIINKDSLINFLYDINIFLN